MTIEIPRKHVEQPIRPETIRMIDEMRDAGYIVETPDDNPKEIARIMNARNEIVMWIQGEASDGSNAAYRNVEVVVHEGEGFHTTLFKDIQKIDHINESDRKVGVGFLDRTSGKKFTFDNITRGYSCLRCTSPDVDPVRENGNFKHFKCEACGHQWT